jgi:SAM-dependent methyltransferase
MIKTDCAVCGDPRRLFLWSHGDDEYLNRIGNRDRVRYYVCRGCGVGYADPRLSNDELDRLYTKSYRTTDGVPEDHLTWKESQSRQRLNWLMGHLPQSAGRVLEIGSSEGVLLRILRDEYGWDVRGCEPYEPYARHGIEKWQLPIDLAFFDAKNFDASFDLVAFMHVIEHIPDPGRFLKTVGRVLKPGSHIFFETPDLLRPYVGKISRALFPSPHLVIYSPESIRFLLESNGFEVLAIEESLNMRVLARWTGIPKALLPADNSAHACSVFAKYRLFFLQEQFVHFWRRAVARFSRIASRLLTESGYARVRTWYRSSRRYLPEQ